jgi:hypothetical protein
MGVKNISRVRQEPRNLCGSMVKKKIHLQKVRIIFIKNPNFYIKNACVFFELFSKKITK